MSICPLCLGLPGTPRLATVLVRCSRVLLHGEDDEQQTAEIDPTGLSFETHSVCTVCALDRPIELLPAHWSRVVDDLEAVPRVDAPVTLAVCLTGACGACSRCRAGASSGVTGA